MFQPSQHDVRRFFCEAWQRWQQKLPLTPMQAQAAAWIAEHPEYHADLADVDEALGRQYPVEAGRSNPFLHLSMHLSLDEQHSIDQPTGVRAALQTLSERLGGRHEAHHAAMEALGTMLWQSQRSGLPPDPHAYLDDLRRRASAD